MLSALVVPVPRADPIVESWLERTVPSKPSIGIPPHVTLLFPFMRAEELDYQVRDDLKHLFVGFEPFGVTFARTARFPTTLYLAPEPAAPFVELTKAICAQWPDYQPYEGEFDEIVPHLTVAQGEPELLDLADADVSPKLPLTVRCEEVLLLEERQRFWQEWAEVQRFPIGAPR